MCYPHKIVLGIVFFSLLAAVFIKCLHYKPLITALHYKYSQHNHPHRVYLCCGFTKSHIGQRAGWLRAEPAAAWGCLF